MPVELGKGTLLVSNPNMMDPNFTRTVVLLCDHGPEGSLGLVLNRPTELNVSQFIDDLDGTEDGLRIYSGGPVARSHLLMLHRLGDTVPGARQVVDDVYLGGDMDLLQQLLQSSPADGDKVRFYLGYSGWGSGQLDYEMSQDAWILFPATAQLIFQVDPLEIWRTVFRQFGGSYTFFGEMPPNPELN